MRRLLLTAFGAKIGRNVILKPGIRVKFPWKLRVGDFCWIGEDVWIDNLVEVEIGEHCCVSQGAYLCTGSHNWASEQFDLILGPIKLGPKAWIAAAAVIGPGVTAGEGSVLTLGSVANSDLEPWTIYSGVPAVATRRRALRIAS